MHGLGDTSSVNFGERLSQLPLINPTFQLMLKEVHSKVDDLKFMPLLSNTDK